ncbi:MAG TPA: hypothetical protein VFQ80_06600, partial [Thermomicrobiales bacterium]|nr:hypothetical protein [Thermomicrobiales bacterium]
MRRALALLVSVLLLAAAPASAAPGDFDESFGGDGIVDFDFGTATDRAYSVLAQPDGGIVMGGSLGDLGSADFAVARSTAQGSPDPGFASAGVATFALNGNQAARAVARQPDGKIVAVGFAFGGELPPGWLVARFNPDGTPDPSFALGAGILKILPGGDVAGAADVVIQPDGKIVVVGYGGAGADLVVTRLTAAGVFDPSFGGGSSLVVDLGSVGDEADGVALQRDGKLLVVGHQVLGPISVLRFNPDGTPDSGFDGDGRRVLDPGSGNRAEDVLVQPDGKIVLSGSAGGQPFLVTRLTSDGSLDGGFGSGGVASVRTFGSATDYAHALALQANGKLVIAGETTSSAGGDLLAVARLQPGGSVDTTFGRNGSGIRTLNGGLSVGYGVALQADGQIVVGGYNSENALAVRLEGDPPEAGGGPAAGTPGGPGGPGGGGGGGARSVPRCAGKKATIVGTNGSNRLKGTRR